jgi:O-antigen ligase
MGKSVMMIILIFLIVFSPYLSIVSVGVGALLSVKNKRMSIDNIWNISMILLVIWSVISGVVNKNYLSFGASVVILLFALMGIGLEESFCREEKIEKLLKYMLFISIGSAFIGILEKVTPIQHIPGWWEQLFGIYQFGAKTVSPRITGTFGNQNVAGSWYSTIVLISLYFYLKAKDKSKNLYGILILLFCIVLYMTGSRAAISGLIAGVIAYIYFTGNLKKAWTISTVFITGIAMMFKFPAYFPRGDILYLSLDKRGIIYKKSLEMILEKPVIGWGFLGTYSYPGLKEFHSHNILLTIGSSLGFVGLTIFIFMNYYLIKELLHLKNNKFTLTPLFASIIVLIFVQGIFDCTIVNPQSGVIYFGLASIINGVAYQYKFSWTSHYLLKSIISPIKKRISMNCDK